MIYDLIQAIKEGLRAYRSLRQRRIRRLSARNNCPF